MKLRIRGNSIRLRLGRSEVARLATDGIIEEFTQFGPGSQRFRYTVHATFLEPSVTARFADGWLVVWIPATELHKWAHGDEVGIEASQRIDDNGEELRILIEKDFVCIDGDSGESQEDAFPNPVLAAGTRSC
jgi:hypothetical protein